MRKQIIKLIRQLAEWLHDIADSYDYEFHDELRMAIKDPPIRILTENGTIIIPADDITNMNAEEKYVGFN